MERRDHTKTGGHHYGAHDEGYQRTDESTVEFSGNISEADLIVDALRVYVAVEDLLRTMGANINESMGQSGSMIGTHFYKKPKVYARDLLAQIAEPNHADQSQETSQKV